LDRAKQMIDKVEFVGQIADYPAAFITMCRIGLAHIAPRPPLTEMLPDIAMRCVNCLSPQGSTQRNDDRMEPQLIGDEDFEWIWCGGFALVSEYRLFDKHAVCKAESFQRIQAFAVTRRDCRDDHDVGRKICNRGFERFIAPITGSRS